MGLLQITGESIEPASAEWRQRAAEHIDRLTMPPRALGRLLDLAEQLAAIRRTLRPQVERKVVVTMAGDHGVVSEGVSAFPQEVTPQMVRNFVAGGAAINVIARVAGARVVVVDMGVAGDLDDLAESGKILSRRIAAGTRNLAAGPAMSREQAVAALEAGIGIVDHLAEQGLDLLATGDMGIGNTTPAAAILSAFSGLPARETTGRGTGVSDAGLENKIRVIDQALAVNRPDPGDPVDVLAKVGGFEIGGIAGLILGAARRRIPVLVDGFISSAGALVARGLAAPAADYMIAAHRSREQGHRLMLELLGLRPLLDLDLRLGEGTGAALAMKVVEAAAAVLSDMATFADAGVSPG